MLLIKLLLAVQIMAGAPPVFAEEKAALSNVNVYFLCRGEDTDYTVFIGRRVLGRKIVSKHGKVSPCVDAISGEVQPGEYLLRVTSKKLGSGGKLKIKVEKDAWILASESDDPKKIELRQDSEEPRFR